MRVVVVVGDDAMEGGDRVRVPCGGGVIGRDEECRVAAEIGLVTDGQLKMRSSI